MFSSPEHRPRHSRCAADLVALNARLTRGDYEASDVADWLADRWHKRSWLGSLGQFKEQKVILFTPRVCGDEKPELANMTYKFGNGYRAGLYAVAGTLAPELDVAEIELGKPDNWYYKGPSIVLDLHGETRTWRVPIAEPHSSDRYDAVYAALVQHPTS